MKAPLEGGFRRRRNQFIRTLRCEIQNQIGVLARLISTIARHDGSIGEVKTLRLGERYIWRDITVLANDEKHFNQILKAVKALPEVSVEQIIDEILERHEGGKIRMALTHPIETTSDLRRAYTPWVARVCHKIQEDPKEAYNYTWIHRTVAIMSNGSRTLGLGNIGPVAAMPVMEGKAALFIKFTGYNMVPILIDTRDSHEFIETAIHVSKSFGAIQLEDISIPECFEIEEELIKRLNMPVMHDDQHGTAIVTFVGLNFKRLRVGQIGVGAAGSAIARLIMGYTKRPVLCCDPNEWTLDRIEKYRGRRGTLAEVMKQSDLIISTTGIEGLIHSSMVRKGQIILALSNPNPEITERSAMRAGAAFYSDGSRVNNVLAYPGIFKGALDSFSTKINDEMRFAAAEAIVSVTPKGETVPDALDPKVHHSVGRAVARAAMDTGVAQRDVTD
jgi:malate dehydrogenase (oxaloacetate-decarboxylating)